MSANERKLKTLANCANLAELVSRCEKIHSHTGWYCMSCDSEVDATYTEHCASCGTPLGGSSLTGNLVEAAKEELYILIDAANERLSR